MAAPVEQSSVTLTGASVALFVNSTEMPMSKVEIKKMAKKTEVTGSTSGAVVAGVNQIWQEYSPGPSGGSLSAEGHWRVGQPITPPQLRQGALYAISAYVRRPGWLNAADPGSAYVGTIFVEDNSVVLDPNSGAVDWRLAASFSGPILDPA